MRSKLIPFLLMLLLFVAADPAFAQSQPLVIVVRDGLGSPLKGVPMVLYLAGPPHEEFDNCVTDEQGQCALNIPPGAYIVTFTQGWRGRAFMPVDQQNGGSMADGGIGGFGIYLEPSGSVQIVTFVIGERDGQLVPLWDMSRDPTAPPQPFAYPDSPLGSPEDALAGINLGGLDAAIPGQAGAAPTNSAAATAQIIVEQMPAAPSLTLTPTSQPSVSQLADDGLPFNVILLGIVGLIAAAVLVIGVLWLARRRG